MLETKRLLEEWEVEIQQLEAALKRLKLHQQRHRLQLRLRTAYQSMQLLHGLSQQLLT